MKKLTVGSLFSGIGGFDLGLEMTGGYKVEWQVEIDPFCQKVLAKHWPDVTRYGDIREVGGFIPESGNPSEWTWTPTRKYVLKPVDLLCGGFPCQDLSLAGQRKGIISGEQSGLWAEFIRIIREIGPQYVLIENVPGLRSGGNEETYQEEKTNEEGIESLVCSPLERDMDNTTDEDVFRSWMGVVLGDLAERGYDAEWVCLRASDVGAPHPRERIFILAHLPRIGGRTRRTQSTKQQWPPDANRPGSSNVANPNSDRYWQWQDQQERQQGRKGTTDAGIDGKEESLANTSSTGQQELNVATFAGSTGYDPWEPDSSRNIGMAQSRVGRDVNGVSNWVDGHWRWPAGQELEQYEWEPRRVLAKSPPNRMGRLKSLGNTVVPQVVAEVGKIILEMDTGS